MSQDQQMIKGQVQKIHIKDDWFEVYQLPYEVYAISEPLIRPYKTPLYS